MKKYFYNRFSFSVSSFSKDNNLDIIVGYNLKDVYNLGSNNVIETMGERFNTDVISILEKGSFYHSITNNHFDLDSAIIIPFDVDFAKKHFKYPEYLMSYQLIERKV